MEKRTLGRTGLKVTVLGYGAGEIGEGAPDGITDEQASRLLNTALDAGINFIDTAPDYGLSEERIGEAIAHRRDEFYLATKCGCNVPRGNDSAPGHVWTRDIFLRNIELSLRRLKTDYVDVWQMHNPAPDDVQAEELVRVMQDVKRQGKVRHVSMSSTLPDLTSYIDSDAFATYQIPYSALEREHEHVITAAAEKGAGVIIRGGVGRGVPGGRRAIAERWVTWEQAAMDDLRATGESRIAFVLRFTITHPCMHTTIAATRNPVHLAENLKAADAGPLAEDVYEEAKRRLDEAGQGPR